MYQIKRRTIQLSLEAYGCYLGLKWGFNPIKQWLLKVVERSSEFCTHRKTSATQGKPQLKNEANGLNLNQQLQSVEVLLTDILVSGQLYKLAAFTKSCFNFHTNSVFLHACKWTYPQAAKDTFRRQTTKMKSQSPLNLVF